MATIRDIAKLTGYSVTTISRVLNNHPYVAEEKRQKVLAVMAELDYKPNQMAQNLSYGKTGNVGVIIPFVDHPFYQEMLQGIIKAAFEQKYKVTLLPTNYDSELEIQYLEEFAAKSFDGLIVITRSNHLETFASYEKYGPIVFCENSDSTKAPFVAIDLVGSLQASIDYLKEKKVKRLGLTLGRSKRLSGNSLNTIAQAKAHFPNFDEADIFWDCIHAGDGYQAATFFKERGVDGIIANGDEVAAVILSQYEASEKPVIIGRENLLISRLQHFTTIDHHLHFCGSEAFRLFNEGTQEQIVVPFELIVRN